MNLRNFRSALLASSALIIFSSSAGAAIGDNQYFEQVWPGTICAPVRAHGDTDFFDNGVENEDTNSKEYHCGLTGKTGQVSRTTHSSCCTAVIDDAIVPSPIDEVKIRVYDGNNDASNSQVECTLERWYMNRSTGSVTFDEDDTDQTSTTGTGNDTLNPILSNQPNDSTNAYYYNVVCTLPGNDVLTSKVWAILAEWDGA